MPHFSPESHKATYAIALKTLAEHELRVTAPRKAILTVLTREHGPFTAEEIHQKIENASCDLVTVYRSLTALEEVGIVRRCDFGNGAYRYEFNHGDHHHHHLICRDCQKVEIMEFCVADTLESIARDRGYHNVTHSLEVFGVCPKCQKIRESKSR